MAVKSLSRVNHEGASVPLRNSLNYCCFKESKVLASRALYSRIQHCTVIAYNASTVWKSNKQQYFLNKMLSKNSHSLTYQKHPKFRVSL